MRRADTNLTSHAEIHVGEFFGAYFSQLGNLAFSRHEAFACRGEPQGLELPSAPKQFLHYFEEDAMPQTRLHRDLEGGMAISLGRLREDTQYDYKFVGLSHNTLRGAAGGAVLLAELLCAKGYI